MPSVRKAGSGATARATRTSATTVANRAPLAPDEPLTLTVYLRHRLRVRRRPGSAVDLAELTQRVTVRQLRDERKRILERSVAQVRRFAEKQRMKVMAVDYLGRRIVLRARAADAERTFATRLVWFDDGADVRHYPRRKPRLPRQLQRIAHTVLGLDTRKPRLTRLSPHVISDSGDGLAPAEIAGLYGLLAAGRGAGRRIAIIEPAGGYRPADVALACAAMQVPVPNIVDVSIDGGRNAPGLDAKADIEVALDIQVVAGVAPAARIVVYFTALSEPGLVAGVSAAVHATPRPDVVIITWGNVEEDWPAESRLGLDAVLQDAVRLGITVVATAGDDLAWEHADGGGVHVNYPASSPYVLGCGGTAVTLDAAGAGIVNEVVWNDRGLRGTGGGISAKYAIPAFQADTQLPRSLNDNGKGRGVPDVAAAAAPVNGYRIFVDGAPLVASGTSAVAPLWGAFIAQLNEGRRESLGFINPQLYRAKDLLNPILVGDNIDAETGLGYRAGPGWNACTGLGSPRGARLIATLGSEA